MFFCGFTRNLLCLTADTVKINIYWDSKRYSRKKHKLAVTGHPEDVKDGQFCCPGTTIGFSYQYYLEASRTL